MKKEDIIEATKLGNVAFKRSEIDAAEAEMHRDRKIISSVEKGGIHIGLTANQTGTQFFSAYYDGFFLGTLSTYDGGETYVFDCLQIPDWMLDACGTEVEQEARQGSLDWSISRQFSDQGVGILASDRKFDLLKKRIQPHALRISRKAAGLSMIEAARMTGTPYRTWQTWEDTGPGGRRPPGLAFAWLELYKNARTTAEER